MVIRPKWAVVAVAVLAAPATAILVWRDVLDLVHLLFVAPATLNAVIGRVEVRADTIRKRNLLGMWSPEIALSDLRFVVFVRNGALGMEFVVSDGERAVSLTTWWWDRWDEVVRAVDHTIGRTGLTVDERTEARLAEITGRDFDAARIASPEELSARAPRPRLADWQSGAPLAARLVVVAGWIISLFPLLGPISEESPEEYPGVVAFAGFVTFLLIVFVLCALPLGLRYAFRVSIATAMIGIALGLVDFRYAPSVAAAETAVFVLMLILTMAMFRGLDPDVRRRA